MADFVLSTVVEKLTNLITEEALLLEGVSDKFEQLRDDLGWMRSFLKDADAEQQRTEIFRYWVSQIRETAQYTEDVIETYIAKAAAQSSWINFRAKLTNRHKVGRQIEKIQLRLENIKSKKEHFGITSISRAEGGEGRANEWLRCWRQPSPDIPKDDDDLVDVVEDTKALIRQLSSIEPHRRVVSIVGMGGLGKTTLAMKVYNHTDIKNQFDCRAFVYVSQDYNRRDTLQKIIIAVSSCNMDELKDLPEGGLVLKLHGLLKDRRYLVILDDIWEMEVWDSLKDVFPSGNMGSKVIVTTRKREVALHADATSEPLEPRVLTEHESLELFLKKALPRTDHLPSDLENLGKAMVAKCGGLPLAVVVLGGLLSRKMKTVEEWQHVFRNISSHLIAEKRLSAILDLSYNDLPFNLKPCFLHLGLFPEDYSIRKTKLMQLWVAEGFLPQPLAKETVEDVAEICLNELIDRCMIQVGERTSCGGRVKTIRIHDRLRDLSVEKGKEESFIEIFSRHQVESSSANRSTKSRRIAIHGHYGEYAFLNPYALHLHSLYFFNLGKDEKLDISLKNFKVLRVLVGVKPSRATTVGSLILLRYLEVGWAKFPLLNGFNGNMKYLQTLNLKMYVFEVPDVIWKMKNLKHLYLYEGWGSGRLDTLSRLQTLRYIDAMSKNSFRCIEDGGLGGMVSLRQLWVTTLSEEKAKLVISIVAERLHHLQSLSLSLLPSESYPTLKRLCDCEHLHKLSLAGKISMLPAAQEFPPNLVKLTLLDSNIGQDSFDKLGRLPNLKMLILGSNTYNQTILVCSSGGFPQLHTLKLGRQFCLKELVVEEKAMTNLKNLEISNCPRLEKIPERFMFITTFDRDLQLLKWN